MPSRSFSALFLTPVANSCYRPTIYGVPSLSSHQPQRCTTGHRNSLVFFPLFVLSPTGVARPSAKYYAVFGSPLDSQGPYLGPDRMMRVPHLIGLLAASRVLARLKCMWSSQVIRSFYKMPSLSTKLRGRTSFWMRHMRSKARRGVCMCIFVGSSFFFWTYLTAYSFFVSPIFSLRWRILLSFKCRNRLLLTGTPIQNTMQEVSSSFIVG